MTDAPKFQRLSDLILKALDLSLAQNDLAISERLGAALEMALTRNAGGADFVERREMSQEVAAAFARLEELKKAG